MAQNKRRRSALRYKGVAQVTTRRARKGVNLRYNTDSHWSNSFYKGLNSIRYTDGRGIVNINRDDAAGFRMYTLTTNNQYANPVVQGDDIITTRTDYINRYPSIIQVHDIIFLAQRQHLKCVLEWLRHLARFQKILLSTRLI